MNVLMIGTLVTSSITEFCFEKNIKISAADIAQKYILNGLQQNKKVVSADAIGAVRTKAKLSKDYLRFFRDEQHCTKGTIIGCGYDNFPLLGFWNRERSLISETKKWANNHKNSREVIVIIYAMTSSGLLAAKCLKKIIPNSKIILCVADLPLLMKSGNCLRQIAKKIDWMRIKHLTKCVDKYLLYTKYMAEYLNIEDENWMLFEGLIDEKRIVTEVQRKNEDNICIYAGNLDSRYGIDILIEAFKLIKKNIKLHIYGAGDNVNRIKLMTADLHNVEYKGQVTQDEIFEIMKSSKLLINPRPTNLLLTKFSCPSKTFEYMASGTPVVMNKLSGLPQEYKPYLYFFETEDAAGYAKKIEEILNKSLIERNDFGLKAANFLIREKNSCVVMNNVIDFIIK